MIEKKEDYLQKKIDEETKKAKANAVTNKTGAWCALVRSPLLLAHGHLQRRPTLFVGGRFTKQI